MDTNETKRVLIDLSIQKEATTHRTGVVKKTITWCGVTQEHDLLVRTPFLPRRDEKFRWEQLPYIASLPDLVRNQLVEFYRSDELMMEDIRNRRREDRGTLGLNLLEGMPIRSIDAPTDRPILIAPNVRFGTTKEEQIEFFKSIREERFLEIRRAVTDAHIIDGYHFWTSELLGLFAFLTVDQKFLKTFRNQAEKRLGSRTALMTPKDLCGACDVGPKDLEQIERDNPPFS